MRFYLFSVLLFLILLRIQETSQCNDSNVRLAFNTGLIAYQICYSIFNPFNIFVLFCFICGPPWFSFPFWCHIQSSSCNSSREGYKTEMQPRVTTQLPTLNLHHFQFNIQKQFHRNAQICTKNVNTVLFLHIVFLHLFFIFWHVCSQIHFSLVSILLICISLIFSWKFVPSNTLLLFCQLN